MVLVFAVVAVTGLLRPQPVTALGELAEVAEQVAPPTAATGEFIYTRTLESAVTSLPGAELGLDDRIDVAFLERSVVERWVAPNGSIHEERTFEAPVFFDSEAEAAYVASEPVGSELVGQTTVDDFTPTSILGERAWPEDPEELLVAMRTFVTNEGSAVISDASVIGLAADLMRAPKATPSLRSAVLGAVDLMDVEIQERSNGRAVIVSLQFTEEVLQRFELEFDADANLVRERLVYLEALPEAGIPAGATIEETVYSVPRVVDSLDGR